MDNNETTTNAGIATSQPKQSKKTGKIVAGTVGIAGAVIAVGAGGYGLGALTNQDIQDFEPVYTISTQDLKTAKTTLLKLNVRSGSETIPDYNSGTMPDWSDIDGDGCPTRYDVLVRDIINEKVDESNCKIKSGTMFDYYTGTLVKYNRLVSGGGIDVDHIVAKGNAWESGGYTWDTDKWKTYINDEEVLMATSAKANRSKGDKDASEWLPSNEKFWCKYVTFQIHIKDKYDLSVTTDEKTTLEKILETNCNKN